MSNLAEAVQAWIDELDALNECILASDIPADEVVPVGTTPAPLPPQSVWQNVIPSCAPTSRPPLSEDDLALHRAIGAVKGQKP